MSAETSVVQTRRLGCVLQLLYLHSAIVLIIIGWWWWWQHSRPE